MQKEYFVDISDQLKKDFEDKNVFFDNRGNGVINIQISRNVWTGVHKVIGRGDFLNNKAGYWPAF